MRVLGLREVSLAAPSVAEATPGLAAITGHPGYELQAQPVPPIQARFRSFAVGDRSIAVMESLGADTPISRFLDRRGAGAFSITLEVADLDEATADCLARGARLVLGTPLVLDGRSGSHRFDRIRVNFVAPGGPTRGLVCELQELRGGRPAPDPPVSPGLDVPDALNEVHVAVRDLDAAARDLAALFGFEVGPVVVQAEPPEEVRFRNLYLGDRPLLALITPATPTSAIGRFLDKRGEAIFSVSLRVPDGRAYARRVRAAGIPLLFDAPKRVGRTRIGPAEISEAAIQWIRPAPASGHVLFEIQEYRATGGPPGGGGR